MKTLRHYHEVELLEPITSIRPPAIGITPSIRCRPRQVVRRLRDLDMPLADVRAVLTTAPADPSDLIARHLERLEKQLTETRSAVESLRAFLEPPHAASGITHRSEPRHPGGCHHRDRRPGRAAAVVGVMPSNGLRSAVPVGAPGALFGFDVFAADRGEVTVFISDRRTRFPAGRDGCGTRSSRRPSWPVIDARRIA